MVGANLKAQTMKLMEKRSALETEMNVIIERLCQPGGPGLSGNLVDSEAHKFSSSSFFLGFYVSVAVKICRVFLVLIYFLKKILGFSSVGY